DRSADLEALAQVVRSIVDERDPAIVRSVICRVLLELTGAKHVVLLEIDDERGGLICTGGHPYLTDLVVGLDGEVFDATGKSLGKSDPPPAAAEAVRLERPIFRSDLRMLTRPSA